MPSPSGYNFYRKDIASPLHRSSFDTTFMRKEYFAPGNLWYHKRIADQYYNYKNVARPWYSDTGWGATYGYYKSVSPKGSSCFHGIKQDGTLWFWGNAFGYMSGAGNYVNTGFTTPVQVASGSYWRTLAEHGGRYTPSAELAIKEDGSLWMWGDGWTTAQPVFINNQWELDVTPRRTPISVWGGGNNWKKVVTTEGSTLALKDDGSIWTWGNAFPNASHNSTPFNSTPTTVYGGGSGWVDIAGFYYSWAAIKTNGTLWMWGGQHYGSLGNRSGNDTSNYISTPVTTFAGGTDWRKLGTSGSTSCAIKNDGTLWTWGWNQYGQTGSNTSNTTSSTPTTTFAGGTDWKECCITEHATAIKTDSTLWRWGNASGWNFPDDRYGYNLTPVQVSAKPIWRKVRGNSPTNGQLGNMLLTTHDLSNI